MVQPPGTILQHMYLAERFAGMKPGTFLEVGSGRGLVSQLLLNLGWTGVGFDLSAEAREQSLKLNKNYVACGKYEVAHCNWLESEDRDKYDLIISCFVLEHLDDEQEARYLNKAAAQLKSGGRVALMVPANSRLWGLEDEIAGHYRRYDRDDLHSKLTKAGLNCNHLAGLNFPVSNILHPLTKLVLRANNMKRKVASKSLNERTISSGTWKIPMLNSFPQLFAIGLNPFVMWPFHVVQKLTSNNKNCVVLYAEATTK